MSGCVSFQIKVQIFWPFIRTCVRAITEAGRTKENSNFNKMECALLQNRKILSCTKRDTAYYHETVSNPTCLRRLTRTTLIVIRLHVWWRSFRPSNVHKVRSTKVEKKNLKRNVRKLIPFSSGFATDVPFSLCLLFCKIFPEFHSIKIWPPLKILSPVRFKKSSCMLDISSKSAVLILATWKCLWFLREFQNSKIVILNRGQLEKLLRRRKSNIG